MRLVVLLVVAATLLLAGSEGAAQTSYLPPPAAVARAAHVDAAFAAEGHVGDVPPAVYLADDVLDG